MFLHWHDNVPEWQRSLHRKKAALGQVHHLNPVAQATQRDFARAKACGVDERVACELIAARTTICQHDIVAASSLYGNRTRFVGDHGSGTLGIVQKREHEFVRVHDAGKGRKSAV